MSYNKFEQQKIKVIINEFYTKLSKRCSRRSWIMVYKDV